MLVVAIGGGRVPSLGAGPHTAVATETAQAGEIRAAILSAPLHREVLLAAPVPLAQETREIVGLVAELARRSIVCWSPRTSVLALHVALRTLPDLPASPALALAALQARVAATWAMAWFPRVGGLHHPTPSLLQHVRSWAPSSGYVTRFDEREPRVLGADRPLDPWTGPATARALINGSAPQALVERFAQAAGHRVNAVDVDLSTGHQVLYGTSRVAELAAEPAAVGDVGAPPMPPVYGTCASCGWEAPASTCPFCHVLVQPNSAQPSTAQTATSERVTS